MSMPLSKLIDNLSEGLHNGLIVNLALIILKLEMKS